MASIMLVFANVSTYSTVKSLQSRVDSQDHRIEILHKMLTDMISSNQNAEKIEKIETQVDGIETQVTELTTTLKAEQESASKTRRRRR